MRVLFVMAYPGYLRYYDSVVRELAEHGNQVRLVFELPRKQAEGLEALADHPIGVTVDGELAKRDDIWKPVALDLRRVTDFLRYLDPQFADASYLRNRTAAALPESFRFLGRLRTLPRPLVSAAIRTLCWLDEGLPRSKAIDRYLENVRPDVVVLTPLVMIASRQTDVVRSAKAAGIPVVAAIASWDHLTTKGLLRRGPDRVLVWNEAQAREAKRLHRVRPSRVEITGAQPFDRWFDRPVERSRDEFCARVGLPDAGPYVLFTGSTASISAPELELEFVRRWVAELRRSERPELRSLNVLVRPHPYNVGLWSQAGASTDCIAIWPRQGSNPVDEHARSDYFDSLKHAAAVVGINTSAMVEAAIVGTPVLTIRAAEFADTQAGTLHFQYLLPENGGFMTVAATFEEHLVQLGHVLRSPQGSREAARRFVGSFVRPHGSAVRATPLVVAAIENAAAIRVQRLRIPRVDRLLARTILLVPLLREAFKRRQEYALRFKRAGSAHRTRTHETAHAFEKRWGRRGAHVAFRGRLRVLAVRRAAALLRWYGDAVQTTARWCGARIAPRRQSPKPRAEQPAPLPVDALEVADLPDPTPAGAIADRD